MVTGGGGGAARDTPINLGQMVFSQKRIQGSLYGECVPTADIPRLARLYRDGTLKLDELITTRYSLDDVMQGFADLRADKNIRGLIDFSKWS